MQHDDQVRHPIRAARLLYSAPSWVLTGPIYLIALMILTGIGYSFWATRDQLVMAPLRLERETVTVQAVVGGIVSRIHVPEGENVQVGTLLAEVQQLGSQEETFVRGVSQAGRVTTYKSVVDGLVTQVHVQPGHMMAPGSPLFTIVKESAALEGRALVQNKDIGAIKKGQPVKIKYFAYPYQEYGIPEGYVTEVATRPSGIAGQESMYVVKVALREETIARRDGRPKPLEIGLEGIGEIKTGEKRLIEWLLPPVSRFFIRPEE